VVRRSNVKPVDDHISVACDLTAINREPSRCARRALDVIADALLQVRSDTRQPADHSPEAEGTTKPLDKYGID
jgi:hypothetical protein